MIENNTPIYSQEQTPKIEVGNSSSLEDIFDYEKTSPTIEKDLESFKNQSSSEKEKAEEKVEEHTGFSLDDLVEEEDEEEVEEEGSPKEEKPQEEIEEYFESAKFVIWIIELVIVWGLNYYLKNNSLDKIDKEVFKKTVTEEKFLIKSWAKVLHKYSFKIGVEIELIFAIGGVYGTKLQNIILQQELKKANKGKNPKPPTVDVEHEEVSSNQKKKENVFDINSSNNDTSKDNKKSSSTKNKETKKEEGFILDTTGIEQDILEVE